MAIYIVDYSAYNYNGVHDIESGFERIFARHLAF